MWRGCGTGRWSRQWSACLTGIRRDAFGIAAIQWQVFDHLNRFGRNDGLTISRRASFIKLPSSVPSTHRPGRADENAGIHHRAPFHHLIRAKIAIVAETELLLSGAKRGLKSIPAICLRFSSRVPGYPASGNTSDRWSVRLRSRVGDTTHPEIFPQAVDFTF